MRNLKSLDYDLDLNLDLDYDLDYGYSLFPIPYSLFPAHYSLLTTHCSLLTTHYSLLNFPTSINSCGYDFRRQSVSLRALFSPKSRKAMARRWS